MISARMQRKIQLKRNSRAAYAVGGVLLLCSLFLSFFQFGILSLISAAICFLYAFKAGNQSDIIPVDEPEEDDRGFPNVSQYTFGDKS